MNPTNEKFLAVIDFFTAGSISRNGIIPLYP